MEGQKMIINTISELYFVIEVGKYLSLIYDLEFSFDDIVIDDKLKNHIVINYLKLAKKEGWVAGLEIDTKGINYGEIDENIGNYFVDLRDNKTEEVLFKGIFEGVKPIKDLPYERIIVDLAHTNYFNEYEIRPTENNKNIFINDLRTKYKYISTLACIYAKLVMEERESKMPEIYREHPMKINWIITKEFVINPLTLVYLVEFANNKGYSWLSITYDDIEKDKINRIITESWLQEGRDKGLIEYETYENTSRIKNVQKTWTIPEKKDYMRKLDIEENDVIYIFERERKNNGYAYSNNIENATLGIIREIKEDSIVIDKISYPLRKVDKERDYEELGFGIRKVVGKDLATKEIRQIYSLTNVAIEQQIGNEQYFIVPIWHIDGKVSTYEKNYQGNYLNQTIYITETEYVATVLVENNIKYNEDKMIDKLIEKGDIVDKGNGDLQFRIIPQYVDIAGRRIILK